MSTRNYSLKEFARRGDAIYKERIEPSLTPKDKGKFVLIDVETGEFEMSRSRLLSTKRLLARLPGAQPWMIRVGHPGVVKFGFRMTPLGQALQATAHVQRQPRYPMKEFSRRGRAIFQKKIEPTLKPKDKGKFVAIDIESGEFEISRDSMRATLKLYERIPDAQPWMERVGFPAVVRFGYRVRAVIE